MLLHRVQQDCALSSQATEDDLDTPRLVTFQYIPRITAPLDNPSLLLILNYSNTKKILSIEFTRTLPSPHLATPPVSN